MGIEISSYAGAMEALRHPELKQALYDAGMSVMSGALITLHGEDHRQRRVVEFGVFGRGFFRRYERDVFARTLAPLLEPCRAAGGTDLVELGYRVIMNLTADFAGIDRPIRDEEATDRLLGLVKTFSEGATLVHSTRAHAEVNGEVGAAMKRFDEVFFQPSKARRHALVDDVAAGRAGEEDLPRDVLTTLLRNTHRVALPEPVLRREIAFFLQAGAHSTANATTHSMHEIFTWLARRPSGARERLLDRPALLQRCVHESLRLHPASPVAWRKATADLQVDGKKVAAGERVTINLRAANRDPGVFGEDAERFDPERELPQNVWPFGLTFGYGTHACLGRDLDGGVTPKADAKPSSYQLGVVTLFVQALLRAGAAPIPDDPPSADANTLRSNWGRYPISLTPEETS
tara:strand:- start:13091 stop:14302 length:1212 start_codon:yes stop_codon:yes gene_type:complete